MLVLVILSMTNTERTILGYRTKSLDILSELRFQSKWIDFPVTDKLFTDALLDSLYSAKLFADKRTIVDFSRDSAGALDRFFAALVRAKKGKGKVRIGYFGDSMIEGDLMTMDLRDTLQKLFGGRGVGFVPITSIVAGFRRTIVHSFSKNWNTFKLTESTSKDFPLGMSGYSYEAESGNYVSYRAPSYSYLLSSFQLVKLYYGKGNPSARVTVNSGKHEKTFPLDGANAVNELVLNDSSAVTEVSLTFICPDPVNVFGVSFENAAGVHLDNYSYRGNSGLALTKIPSSVLRGFDKKMNYDLIVLHYGLNVVAHNIKKYDWYTRGLGNMLDYMRENFPNASIMMVSVNDKSWHSPDGWVTEPDVPILVEEQRKMAMKKGFAFWSLYDAMGGKNSMVHWVTGDTVLANKDYTHPNHKGAKKISDMLIKEIMRKYEEYNKKKHV